MTSTAEVSAGPAPMVVAYGTGKPPAEAAGLVNLPRVQLHLGEVLRLNSEEFDLPPPVIGQETVAPDIRLADHLKHLSGGWNRTAVRFIDGYFAHLRAVIADHRQEIAQRLGPVAGLFAPEDMLYSAPLPLPRTLLPLPSDSGGDEHIPVDMFFWLGGYAEAVLFAPSTLMPAAERRRRERLAAAGIRVTCLPAGDIARPETFAALLGETGGAFWRDDALPVAPGAPRLPAF
ncbi:hypothetical protein [Ancylobacter defluvii]|uniref:Uncharacterized protein n=1 Tax=Ancylobacter defluvii TaxID=1282440 RepID=A0A9W6NBQ4_9HYPH|nr:hypothetical protein [Ancylobacter defluvii]MBS7589149.1 hypothetical protein [Ancylobacter defluvii]GLK84761.1 hypothetical protein GCM10017653_28310 [Ancylobacter defluvii]